MLNHKFRIFVFGASTSPHGEKNRTNSKESLRSLNKLVSEFVTCFTCFEHENEHSSHVFRKRLLRQKVLYTHKKDSST